MKKYSKREEMTNKTDWEYLQVGNRRFNRKTLEFMLMPALQMEVDKAIQSELKRQKEEMVEEIRKRITDPIQLKKIIETLLFLDTLQKEQ